MWGTLAESVFESMHYNATEVQTLLFTSGVPADAPCNRHVIIAKVFSFFSSMIESDF